MIESKSEFFWAQTDKNIKIITDNGRYGIKYKEETVIPFEYDNIFIYGVGLFVLYKGGKIGAVKFEQDSSGSFSLIAECKYDTLTKIYYDLIFSDAVKHVCYISDAKHYNEREVWKFKILHFGDGYFYGYTDKFCRIIDPGSGEVIWQESINNKYVTDLPCFVYCGKINKRPLFFDITSGRYIEPTEIGYAAKYHYPLQKPIIICNRNIINICETSDKIGILDIRNKKIIMPKYDEIKLELKVTMKAGDKERSEIYEIPASTFTPETISPFEEWR